MSKNFTRQDIGDLNPLPLGYKPAALPLCHRDCIKKVVNIYNGIEPKPKVSLTLIFSV